VSGASVSGSCHCGAVRFTLATAPETVTECNCSICRRYGVIWAYYAPDQVQFGPASQPVTDTYLWDDRSLAFHRCRLCGCVTHWAPEQSRDQNRMGINARLLDPAVLAAARLRRLDGAVTERYIDD
jgi:hypothetical protein